MQKICYESGAMTMSDAVVRRHIHCSRLFTQLDTYFVSLPDEVIQIFHSVVAENVKKLGSERLIVLEQVFIAALDCGLIKLAEDCFRILISEFPESLRVMKLKSMLLEALVRIGGCELCEILFWWILLTFQERYDDALDVLETIIKKDETNAAARKRRVAIFKAKGQISEAIKELSDYLKRFMSDQEAWQELSTLYLQEGEYSRAAFCLEEVLLHNPYSHLIHQRLGEIRYTMGGQDNIEIAKSYYAQAIKLNGKNLRALYGLYLCCSHIVASKAQLTKRKEAQKLSSWALEQIASITKAKPSKKSKNSKNQLSNECDDIAALEAAFGGLDAKLNWFTIISYHLLQWFCSLSGFFQAGTLSTIHT